MQNTCPSRRAVYRWLRVGGPTLAALAVVLSGAAHGETGLASMELTSPDATAALPVACTVAASDVPDDGGGSLLVTWNVQGETAPISLFEILR